VRVPNLWQATDPTHAQAGLLASWDVVGALDGGPPAVPPAPGCTPGPLASPWQLPRGPEGCQCAYLITLAVGDTTWVTDSGENNNSVKFYALNVINDITSAVYTGTVNTSTTSVTWVSGMHFQLWWASGSPISINGTTYTIVSVTSVTTMTVTTSAGTQTGVAYSYNS
jgi:hypothetical protein